MVVHVDHIPRMHCLGDYCAIWCYTNRLENATDVNKASQNMIVDSFFVRIQNTTPIYFSIQIDFIIIFQDLQNTSSYTWSTTKKSQKVKKPFTLGFFVWNTLLIINMIAWLLTVSFPSPHLYRIIYYAIYIYVINCVITSEPFV